MIDCVKLHHNDSFFYWKYDELFDTIEKIAKCSLLHSKCFEVLMTQHNVTFQWMNDSNFDMHIKRLCAWLNSFFGSVVFETVTLAKMYNLKLQTLFTDVTESFIFFLLKLYVGLFCRWTVLYNIQHNSHFRNSTLE